MNKEAFLALCKLHGKTNDRFDVAYKNGEDLSEFFAPIWKSVEDVLKHSFGKKGKDDTIRFLLNDWDGKILNDKGEMIGEITNNSELYYYIIAKNDL